MNTNDRLENRLQAQAAEIFAADTPPAGHRERFAQRLDAERALRRRRRLSWRLAIGAVALAAAVALTAVWLWPTTVASDGCDDAAESPVEVQRYYAMKLDHELEATRALIGDTENEDRRALLEELQAMQAEGMPDVQLPDDERITLIVRVYTSKIDALKHIQTQLSTHYKKEES